MIQFDCWFNFMVDSTTLMGFWVLKTVQAPDKIVGTKN